jgi:guanine deaminase
LLLLQVGLGTDVSGGYSPSILTTVQNAATAAKVVALTSPADPEEPDSFASKPLKIATLFWLATLGGAQVCNLDKKIGSLTVGKSFDAIVVDIRNTSGQLHHHHHHAPPLNPNIWGVNDDRSLGLDIRRHKDEEVPTDEETKLKQELDAMLERLLFSGDDRNLRRVYVQGRWIGGTERHVVPAN